MVTRGIGPELAAVAALALALRVAMAWAIPLASGSPDPNCAPDENAHFTFVAALSRGTAPTWPDGTRSIYGAFVPAPYLAQAAALAALGDLAHWGRFAPVEAWARGFQAARLGSAVLGAVASAALAFAAWAWTRRRGAALLAGLVAAAWPQHVFLGAYVNSDAFTVAAGALHVAALAAWARAGEGAVGLGWLGASAGMVVLGKPSGFFLLLPTAAWVAWATARHRVAPRALCWAAVTGAAVCVPFLAWNAFRNGGDPLGLSRYGLFLREYWGGRDGRVTPDAWRLVARLLPRSTFGAFGNVGVFMPAPFQRAAAALLLGGLTAAAVGLRRAAPPERRAARWLVAAALVNLGLVLYNCFYVDFSPQGRYLLPTALVLAGVAAWAPAAATPGPRWRDLLRWAWRLTFAAFLVLSAVQAQIQVYKHPCLPR